MKAFTALGSLYITFFMTLLMMTILVSLVQVESAVAMSHAHSHKHSPSPGREREEDGAYSPRDSKHMDQHGAHHSEFDHEAILGSAKEAEEFDNLSPEEAKKRLRVLVEKIDIDKNQQIEKKELKAWIIRSFKMLAEEEARERLEEVDENEDGLASWKEYVEETYGVNSDVLPIPLESLEEKKMLADDKALFQTADKNGDGFLTLKEFIPFSHPEEDPDMLPVVYQQTLDDKDKNGDGQIDFKEFIGDRATDKDKTWLEGEKEKFDQDLDKNGDGLLDRQEILSWVVPSNEEIADDEVAHLFASADDNQDEILSYEEIIDHHDVFVGSEATDYGDHLYNMDRFKDEL